MFVRNTKGFTLIELLVVIAVLMLLVAISVLYFRGGESTRDARFAAQSLASVMRQAQNYSQTGQTVELAPSELSVPDAYGVHVETIDDAPVATLFADLNGNGVFDGGEEYPSLEEGVVILDIDSLRNVRDEVVIQDILVNGVGGASSVDVVFESPDARGVINANDALASFEVLFENGGDVRSVVYDRVSGRIDAEY